MRQCDLYSSSANAPSASKKQVKIALRHCVNNSYLLMGAGSHEHLKGRLREEGMSALSQGQEDGTRGLGVGKRG